MGKLTAAQVKYARPGRHGDGRGLYLQVIGGSKTWVLRYEHRKRERWMGLGSAEFVTLAQARERAFELRRRLKDQGIDPLEAARGGRIGSPHFGAQGHHLRGGRAPVYRSALGRVARRRDGARTG